MDSFVEGIGNMPPDVTPQKRKLQQSTLSRFFSVTPKKSNTAAESESSGSDANAKTSASAATSSSSALSSTQPKGKATAKAPTKQQPKVAVSASRSEPAKAVSSPPSAKLADSSRARRARRAVSYALSDDSDCSDDNDASKSKVSSKVTAKRSAGKTSAKKGKSKKRVVDDESDDEYNGTESDVDDDDDVEMDDPSSDSDSAASRNAATKSATETSKKATSRQQIGAYASKKAKTSPGKAAKLDGDSSACAAAVASFQAASGVNEDGSAATPQWMERRVEAYQWTPREYETDVSQRLQRDRQRPGTFAYYMRGQGSAPAIRKSLTALEKQVLECKEKNVETVLAVECGYKYRFFGEDAEIASAVLRIECFLNGNFLGGSIPTHRLPIHMRRLVNSGYKVGVVAQTETAALKKVSSASKTKLFTRDLTAVYTRSTLISEDCDGAEPGDIGTGAGNFLIAIHQIPRDAETEPRSSEDCDEHADETTTKLAYVAVDASTGYVRHGTVFDNATGMELDTVLETIRPVEILCDLQSLSSSRRRILESFAAATQARLVPVDALPMPKVSQIVGDFQATFLPGRLWNVSKDAEMCFAMVFEFLSAHKLENVLVNIAASVDTAAQTSARVALSCDPQHSMTLDAATLRNLAVVPVSASTSAAVRLTSGECDSIFDIVNHTKTGFGCRMLREWVLHPLTTFRGVRDRHIAVAAVISQMSEADQRGANVFVPPLQRLLAGLPDLERGLVRCQHGQCSTLEFVQLIQSFERIVRVCSEPNLRQWAELAHSHYHSDLWHALFTDFPCDTFSLHIANIRDSFDVDAAKRGCKEDLFLSQRDHPACREIMDAQTRMREIESLLRDELHSVRKTLKLPSLEWKKVLLDEYLIEVPRSMESKISTSWTKVNSTKKVARFRSPESTKLLEKLMLERERLALASRARWAQLLKEFSENSQDLRDVVRCLSAIDCIFSLASSSLQMRGCRPTLRENARVIDIVDGRHPLIERSLRGGTYVPNDVGLCGTTSTTSSSTAGEGEKPADMKNGGDVQNRLPQALVITGPNMGGKSCYMRQTAVAVLLNQIGCFVPAQSATMGVFDGIFTRMGASDSLAHGQSTFLLELTEMSVILQRATANSLVILDELGRGTATYDGMAIAHATLQHILERLRCVTLFATHYPSLGAFEARYPGRCANVHLSFLGDDAVDNDNDSGDTDSAATDVTFLYRVVRGLAKRSFGVHVARMAGLPETVLSRAAMQSTHLHEEVKRTYREQGVKTLRRLKEVLDDDGSKAAAELVELHEMALEIDHV